MEILRKSVGYIPSAEFAVYSQLSRSDVRATGQFAYEDASFVPYEGWVHVFVGMCELVNRMHVHTSFVGKGASADKGLAIARDKVRRFVDEAREFGEVIQGTSAEDFIALFLKLKVGDNAH